MTDFIKLAGLDTVPAQLKGAQVAIGNFDGFHRGHQHVFAALKERARQRGVPAVVLTFEPHPRDVFAPEPFMFRLTEGNAKARLAEALGLDGIVIMPFTRDLSQVEAEDFVSRYLVDALAVSGVIVGADFHFGRGRRGTPDFLRSAGAQYGFEVETLALIDDGTEPISSSRVRSALGVGDLATANTLLGYHWFVEGEIVSGDRRGRELGFPTANMATHEGFHLAQGVYAVRARLGDRLINGVASFGKPMFNNQRPPFETHLFDFHDDIYGAHLSVALIAHIRGQEVFSGLDDLIAAMNRDSRKAEDALNACAPKSELDRKLGFFG
ncbi:bifunctional riboflavin kinase/FAD synthetase [Paradevosia shaoguanensis]|uniref:bifunctional riboflavin kinase/FAD synthetase n=1 Tax=Paradevosia shaoguanensis TaxID=1335043 RepID=UPI001931721A|nr:bifunctional riboflavin kinase/FAD synthetase [Paradevosia shaoguanensis]